MREHQVNALDQKIMWLAVEIEGHLLDRALHRLAQVERDLRAILGEGSTPSPSAISFFVNGSVDRYGDGADCRSVVLRCPEGSIPSTPTTPL